jgi:hypothetical protein
MSISPPRSELTSTEYFRGLGAQGDLTSQFPKALRENMYIHRALKEEEQQ